MNKSLRLDLASNHAKIEKKLDIGNNVSAMLGL